MAARQSAQSEKSRERGTRMPRVGSILHGAYGDYYEQMVCLKRYARLHPDVRLVLFFAEASRLREMQVFDLSFACEVHGADALAVTPVDSFVQYQVKDEELRTDVLDRLPAAVRARIDETCNLKPWHGLRRIDLRDPANDVGLSAEGVERLPACMRANGIDEGLFESRFTVGFLWRYRQPGGYVRTWGQTPEAVLRETKTELFNHLIRRHQAHVLIAGMNVQVTDENRERISGKYTDQKLDLAPAHCTYLKGLSWGLELEIMRRCSLCLVMPSGFSEALWIKRNGPTLLVDAPPDYLLRLLYNRMPFYDLAAPSNLGFQLRQPHTCARVLRMLDDKRIGLPSSTGQTHFAPGH